MKFTPISYDERTAAGFKLTPDNDAERFALRSTLASAGAVSDGTYAVTTMRIKMVTDDSPMRYVDDALTVEQTPDGNEPISVRAILESILLRLNYRVRVCDAKAPNDALANLIVAIASGSALPNDTALDVRRIENGVCSRCGKYAHEPVIFGDDKRCCMCR